MMPTSDDLEIDPGPQLERKTDGASSERPHESMPVVTASRGFQARIYEGSATKTRCGSVRRSLSTRSSRAIENPASVMRSVQ